MAASSCATQECMCLSDPMDPTTKICAYINRQNGLVYPCESRCCSPACNLTGQQPRSDLAFTQTRGVTLPEEFGTALPTNDLPSPQSGTPITEVKEEGLKIKTIMIWALVLFLIIIVSALIIG